MVNANTAFKAAVKILKDSAIDEALHEARLLFKLVTYEDVRIVSDNYEISTEAAEKLFDLCRKRATRYPIQYILGKWPFLDFELIIGEGVLIPRADSELLCITAAEKCRNYVKPRVLDLCAGSGAIAKGVKSLINNADVSAIELLKDAYKYLELNCSGEINCICADIFDFNKQLEKSSFDIITANPPYITKNEMKDLEPELSAEPRTALTDEGDGLSFYRHIASSYKHAVSCGGWLLFEIGCTQGEDVLKILRSAGWSKEELLFDFSGNARVVLACNL